MTTPEEELEAAIWQAMKRCGVTVASPLEFIELMTFAAQRYAAEASHTVVTAQRRAILHEARDDIGGGRFRWGPS